MRKGLFIIGLLSISTWGFCQKPTAEIKADKHYYAYHWYNAIEKYESIEDRGVDATRKLADSYRHLGNTEKAEVNYYAVASSDKSTPEDIFWYAEMLLMNGKADDADHWMQKFKEKTGETARVEKFTQDKAHYYELKKDIGRFSIVNLDVNTANEDFGATFYKDKVVFASSRSQGVKSIKRQWNWNQLPFLDMYVADKAEDMSLSNPTTFHKHYNAKYHEGPASFSTDGSHVVFTRNNYEGKSKEGVIKLKLYYADMVDGEWGEEKEIHFNSHEYSVGHPSLSADGKTLYFSSDMPGGKGGVDIYKVERLESGDWGKPENLGAPINTVDNEMFPFHHEDGTLFFSSNGHFTLGGLDVFYAKEKDEKFSEPVNLGYPINDNKDDFAFVLDKDLKYGYFASNREGGKGSDDIYSFEMLKPLKQQYFLSGIALNKEGETPLPGTVIVLENNKGDILDSVKVKDDGKYQFGIEPGTVYKLKGAQDEYFPVTASADATKLDATNPNLEVDLVLEKDPGLSLYLLITDKATVTALKDVNVTIVDNFTNETIESFKTPGSGDFRKPLTDKKLNDNISYQIKIEKQGYLSKTVTYNKKLTEPGEYKVHKDLDITLDKIDVGLDLATIIDIEPIYFDLGKWNIRDDAKVELDKIVKVMSENPTMVVELGSHTDCRASKAFNKSLSGKRAKSSAEYIKGKIPAPERIYGRGYGEAKLVNKCECEGATKVPCSEEEHQENRRTEFTIVKM